MSIGSILFGFSLVILVGLFLSRPFMIAPTPQRRRRRRRHALTVEKNALLEQIRALDFEHETGKMPTDVYEAERDVLVSGAAVLMQKLDAPAEQRGRTAQLDASIEAAVANLRGQPVAQPAAVSVPAPANQTLSAGGFCTQCGNPVQQDDKFCATCGHNLIN